MGNKTYWLAYCPHCSAPYEIQKNNFEGFKRCNFCRGAIKVGEPYIKNDIEFVKLVPDFKGDSFVKDGYTVENGVLTHAEPAGDVVNIPNGVVAIGEGVFMNNKKIKKVTIPDSVLYIDEEAFAYCENIRELTLPRGLISRGNCAFCSCRRLLSVKIPKTLKAAGYSIFYHCDNLVEADFPLEMDFLAGSPYRYCKKIKRRIIPNYVTNLMAWFTDTNALEEIVVGTGITRDEHIPITGIKKLTLVKTDGWYIQEGYLGKMTEINPKELSDPKKAALLLYRLRRDKLCMARKERHPSVYGLFYKPEFENDSAENE